MFFILFQDYIQINFTIAGICFLAKFMTILQSVELSQTIRLKGRATRFG